MKRSTVLVTPQPWRRIPKKEKEKFKDSKEEAEWKDSLGDCTSSSITTKAHLQHIPELSPSTVTERPTTTDVTTDGFEVREFLKCSNYTERVFDSLLTPRPTPSLIENAHQTDGVIVLPLANDTRKECASLLNLLKSVWYTDTVYGNVEVQFPDILQETEELLRSDADHSADIEKKLSSALDRLKILYSHLSLQSSSRLDSQ